MPLLALAIATTFAASDLIDRPPPEPVVHPVPVYVPRGVSLGLFVNLPTVAPMLRLQWEATLYEQPRNHLTAFLAGGAALSLNLPASVRALYQYVTFAGIGYKSTREVLHWGFQIGAGVVWYRASYAPAQHLFFESRVLGYSEGRIELGARVTRSLILGGYVGYGSPWEFNDRFPAVIYVAGPVAGVFLDWR